MPSTHHMRMAGLRAVSLPPRRRLLAAGVLAAALASPVAARCQARPLTPPDIPDNAVSGGQVMLEVAVAENGSAQDVTVLKGTPPFVEPTVAAVRSWALGGPARHVLVAASVRAPELVGAAMVPPTISAQATGAIPVPVSAPMPEYPADGVGSQVVIVALHVDAQGHASEPKVVLGGGAFADVALSTTRRWTFRPAQPEDVTDAPNAYLIFAFREPIVPPAQSVSDPTAQ